MGDRRPFIALLSLALAVPTGLAITTAQPAHALDPSITVDTWDDELNADGDCSLREAVETLNTAIPVDACALPASPVIEIPGPLEGLGSPLAVSETMTIRGTTAVPASIACSAVVGNCIDNVGVGSDLDLENLWISMAPGLQVYAAPGAGHLHLRDVNVWGGAGGVVSQGGAIAISSSTVWDTSDWGVFSLNGDVSIDHSTLGGHDSGAVYVDLADVDVSSSAIYDNEGFGIFGQSGEIDVVNTTISGNGADATRTDDGVVTYRSATVVGNRRALNVVGSGETRFSNTVVAESNLGNCDNPVTSLGFNVSDDDSCAFGEAIDRTAIDPGLLPFDNLAPSPIHPLAESSALIDTGGDCLAVDQVDAARPTDGDGDGTATCDVGAVEAPAVPFVPTPTDPDPTAPADPGTPGGSPATAPPATPVPGRPTFTG